MTREPRSTEHPAGPADPSSGREHSANRQSPPAAPPLRSAPPRPSTGRSRSLTRSRAAAPLGGTRNRNAWGETVFVLRLRSARAAALCGAEPGAAAEGTRHRAAVRRAAQGGRALPEPHTWKGARIGADKAQAFQSQGVPASHPRSVPPGTAPSLQLAFRAGPAPRPTGRPRGPPDLRQRPLASPRRRAGRGRAGPVGLAGGRRRREFPDCP